VSNILTQTAVHGDPIDSVAIEQRTWRRWPKLIILLLVFLWLANAGISFLIQHTALKRKINARLESAFGRSVEVGSYSFSLWGRPTIEARSVVVGEDPRFGREYFLRAESLTMSLRWQSLMLGHLELGAISLERPSLNLVRNLEGDWNLAEWLPRLPATPSAATAPLSTPKSSSNSSGTSTALRFTRINVDSGRINFKRGDEKLPFAFVGVTGYLAPEGPGQWRMDLEATPSRAAVVIQQAGTLHLSGLVGGTSSRLRPAALDLAWTEASISDVLRLARGTDYGIRGNLAVLINARADAQDWLLQARAEIREVHRWDLPLRADNPSVNLIAKVTYDPEQSGFDVVESVLETPRSNARAAGIVNWSQPVADSTGDSSQSALRIVSDGINLGDALAWTRAFHSGVSDDLALQGFAKLDLTLDGWPPRIDTGALSIESAQLTGKTLPVPVRMNLASLRYGPNGVSMQPATLSFGASGGALHLESAGVTNAKATSGFHVAGSLADAGNLISAARLFGRDISRGWDLTGPVRGDLRWQGPAFPWREAPVGTLDFGAAPANIEAGGEASGKSTGDTLRAPFLNLPVEQIKAHVDLKPDARHIALTSARAFGALWNGTFDRRDPPLGPVPGPVAGPANPWRFGLSADKLTAADIDRWLNPRWRESFIDRVLPFLNSRPLAAARPEYLAASGKISIDQFTLAPLVVHRVQGDATIDGRRVTLANFRAQLYKGDVSGSIRADLDAAPAYRVNLDFANVDLSSLTASSPSLADRFDGSASGKISIDARGATRSDLLSSLQCRGTARINGAEISTIDLSASFSDGAFRPGKSAFREASADFTCAGGKLEFQHLLLSAPAADIAGEGTADFGRNLDFKLAVLPQSSTDRDTQASEPRAVSYRIAGTLAEPEITRLKSAPVHP
jgi:hypothetical protein